MESYAYQLYSGGKFAEWKHVPIIYNDMLDIIPQCSFQDYSLVQLECSLMIRYLTGEYSSIGM